MPPIDIPVVESEESRLRRVEAAALRVASSRRNGVVLDQGALDRLDAALEGHPHPACVLTLSVEQLAYLRRVITDDVEAAVALVDARSFSQYAPRDAQRVLNTIALGVRLLGQLPPLASQSTTDHQE